MSELPPGVVPESEYKQSPEGLPEGVVPESQIDDNRPPSRESRPFEMSPLLHQGLTFGFYDEMAGAARAIGPLITGRWEDVSEAYESGRKEALDRAKAQRKESPILGTAQEIAGGIVSGGALKAAPAAASKMAQLFARLPAWMRTTALGGMWGSIFGAGTSEPGQRLSGAAYGGTAGAITGGIIHGGVRGIQAGTKGVSSYIAARRDPYKQGARLIGEKLRADEISAAKLHARLRELGPQATIADAGGENVLGLARGAAGQPGPAKNRIMQTLNQRAEGEAARIVTKVKNTLGPGDYFASEDALLGKLSAGAKTAYTEAYKQNPEIMSKPLERMLKSPVLQKALKEAADIAGIERAAGRSKWLGPVDKELTDLARYARDLGKMESVPRPGVAKGFSLETWDYVKRGIDALLDKPAYRNELTGKLNKKGAAINDLRKALVRQLDKITGGEKSLYVHARKQYGDVAETIGALRDGKKFMRMAPEQIRKELSNLSEAGKAAYRNGAARAIIDIVEGVPDTASAANRLFNKSINRAKIKSVFPENKDFGKFAKSMVAEQRFAKVKNDIGAGSRTAPMSAEIADVQQKVGNLGAVLGSMSDAGGHALVKAGIGRRLLQGMLGSPEAMNREIAKALMTRNPAEQLRLLDALAPHLVNRPDVSPVVRALVLGTTQQEAGAINR